MNEERCEEHRELRGEKQKMKKRKKENVSTRETGVRGG
jgi:hypothetical protein